MHYFPGRTSLKTQQHAVRVPVDLMAAARHALGQEQAPASDVVRAALALAAGLDVRDWTPPIGRPTKRNQAQVA